MMWLWGSVCDADLTPPKSLWNAGLCHSHGPTPPSPDPLCTPLPAPVAWGAGAGHWQPGVRESSPVPVLQKFQH